VAALGSRRLVDFVGGEVSGSSEIRSLDFLHEFISHGAQRVAALGDFHQMDVGIEVVEGRQFRVTDVDRRIHAQQVDRVGPSSRGSGLGNLAIQNGPYPSKARELVGVGFLLVAFCPHTRAQCLWRTKSTGGER
jgi:hypothetical protein